MSAESGLIVGENKGKFCYFGPFAGFTVSVGR
jgi:hypothetical protein